ncbi:hypothetical protein C9I57_07455 [Trinickia symbiotica]|uniref:Uncharacterized protein n=1 Tax=Trinickia symbiotica TaxID=863227 RepID=A0A2T3XY88_9BURK|nr:hypothetical protein C9I57_07455 [Trinickia symbiotica]
MAGGAAFGRQPAFERFTRFALPVRRGVHAAVGRPCMIGSVRLIRLEDGLCRRVPQTYAHRLHMRNA